MTQKAAAKTTTTDENVEKAKRLFFVGLFDVSWRLALCIIIPLVLGDWLDSRYGNGLIFTITGMLVGFGLSIWMIKLVAAKMTREMR